MTLHKQISDSPTLHHDLRKDLSYVRMSLAHASTENKLYSQSYKFICEMMDKNGLNLSDDTRVTVSFDPAKYKLVPLEATEDMISDALCGRVMPQSCEAIDRIRQQMKSDIRNAIAAAPELGSE